MSGIGTPMVVPASAILAALALAACSSNSLFPGDSPATTAPTPPPGQTSSGITTGSILPALPSLPPVGSLLPSFSNASGSRRPERIGSNLYRLPAVDLPNADAIQRENYTLLRAAEMTKAENATHFVIVDLNDQVGAASGAPRGNGSTLVRILTIEHGAEAPVGAVSATEIIQFFGPTFGRTVPMAPAAAPMPPSAPAPAPPTRPALRGT